ncbi:MAG: peptidylprolyl isomerase [Thermodesulfobacteriota bacterium]
MRSFCKKALLAALFVAMLSPAASAAVNKINNQDDSPIMLRVDDEEFTQKYFDASVEKLLPLVAFHNSLSDERMRALRKKTLKNIINRELIFKYAKEHNKDKVPDKDIDQNIEELKKKLRGGDTIEKVLERSEMTMEEFRAEVNKGLAIANTIKDKKKELKDKADSIVTRDYMLDYYKHNLDKFKEPEQIHIRTILVKADPSGGIKVWDAARKKLEGIRDTIEKGMDFSEAAKEFSEDPYAEKGGDMGWSHRGSIMAEFEEATAGRKTGEIVGPFASLYGYHLAKIEGIRPAVQRKFKELNLKNLEKDLQKKEFSRLWKEWLEDMKSKSKVEVLIPIK